jgi:hypothetical protein
MVFMARSRTILAPLILMLFCLPAHCQLTAGAAITMTARLPSSITLNLKSIPVSINVADGTQQPFSAVLSMRWNVDPHEVPAFRVVAHFRNAQSALVDPTGTTSIPASDLVSRWTGSQFLPFGADATIILFQMTVEPEHRMGAKRAPLELKIADDQVNSLPDGAYTGVLEIEVRQY